ncbi:hypothetical protein [Carboxylicivirga caseinilyticus]|uniref:hypothetical protein n=1 Tax=Carboxylicivirga caseinilyticus TaxID=3417572 RepID=UPI003D326C36|nr:hypothetical protein [Marinilabiliaceae bacterium A049]
MKALPILLLIALLFSACTESILSDIEIADPYQLKVKVKIEQNNENDKEIQVFIRDTKNHPVDLLTGKVIVNDHYVSYSRAMVNSAGARGYIYRPHNDEQVFDITIYWNSVDYHRFLLSPANGWPGFYCNHSHWDDEDVDFESDNYSLRPAPFYDNEIDIAYTIMNGW